jgi:carbonic anhydrase/acetyltransferase-like protein (isoleucine patch superfamily)
MNLQTEFRPQQIHPTVFLAQGAIVVGNVTLSEACSVWFHASLRGDVEPIMIGPRTNIQEGAIFHVDPGFPVRVGVGVTVGHGAIVHGATIGDNVVVGMHSTILNGAVIGADSIVGANSLVTEGKHFPAGSLIIGSPARVARALTTEEIERNRLAADTYVKRAVVFKAQQRIDRLGGGQSS